MKVAVFVPTFRPGGIDVTEASLLRQTHRDFILLVCDNRERDWWWELVAERNSVKIGNIRPPKINSENGEIRNLARAYNLAAETCLESGCDLLVSLQDYIWLPSDGVERFVKLREILGSEIIMTGLTSISLDPRADAVYDPEGAYTIFKEPYRQMPKEMKWHDVRKTEIYRNLLIDEAAEIISIAPDHWEANWAAVPKEVLERVKWDEVYDKGIAYENADFAMCCDSLGVKTILDGKNHAISLPHFDYFAGQKEDIVTYSNRAFFDERWNR